MAEEETPKKTTRKRTTRKKTEDKPAETKKVAPKEKSFGELKREDAQRRLKEAREAGTSFGLDDHDPLLGWDAQQGRVRPVEG